MIITGVNFAAMSFQSLQERRARSLRRFVRTEFIWDLDDADRANNQIQRRLGRPPRSFVPLRPLPSLLPE